MTSVASYRGTARPDNECNLVRFDQRARWSPRGRRMQAVYTAYLMGEIQDTGTSLISKANSLVQQFSLDYGDFTYTIDGVATPHFLTNNNSVSGVKVMYRSWSRGDAAELATKRTYSIVLQATYDDAIDNIVFWQENLKYIGNTGPSYEVINTFNGPYFALTANSTPQRIIQYGRAVGYTAYPLPPGSYFPANEHLELREVDLGSGQNQGQGARFFTTTWKYVHTLSTPQETIPQTL